MTQVWWLLQLQYLTLREVWLVALEAACNPLSPYFGEIVFKLRDVRERKEELWSRFN